MRTVLCMDPTSLRGDPHVPAVLRGTFLPGAFPVALHVLHAALHGDALDDRSRFEFDICNVAGHRVERNGFAHHEIGINTA